MRGLLAVMLLSFFGAGVCSAAGEQPSGAAAKSQSAAPPLFPGATSSKEPINIEADRLEYFNKEQKAIYIGNVVVVQGDSTLKCSKLTIFLDRQDQGAGAGKTAAAKAPPANGQAASSGQVKHMDAEGPVSFFAKDQAGSGDRAEFDREQNKVFIVGHVILTQGENITRGDKLIYDLTSGEAVVESSGDSGRVSGFFVPGSGDDGKKQDKKPDDKSTAATKPPAKPVKAKPRKLPSDG